VAAVKVDLKTADAQSEDWKPDMALRIRKGTTADQVPMTPMIDVVFNLLIFFLVASKFAEVERDLRLRTPEASAAKPATSQVAPLEVSIDAQGRYYAKGAFRTLSQLELLLRQEYANNPGRAKVRIRADEQCRWQAVVAVINKCLECNIRDYVAGVGGEETPR
jgi:biopolymer transport protein ExbD